MMLFWGPVLVIGLTALVVWAIRSSPPQSAGVGGVADDPLTSARRILAERYARGELDSDEYRERVDRLN